MEAAGFPFCLSPSPLRAPSRADPSGLGHAATIYSSVQGPPRGEKADKGNDIKLQRKWSNPNWGIDYSLNV
jgi:hypothetical protein